MAHAKADVVRAALAVLDEHGLPGLSMRRLAARLGVQQSALYWHFESKQLLLAAVAEEILRRGPVWSDDGAWDAKVEAHAEALRDALLNHRDGAELVSTVYAFGLGAREPHRELAGFVASAGVAPRDAQAAATVLLHFVLGFAFSEQQYLQASSAGAIKGPHPHVSVGKAAETDAFRAGVALILDGVSARLPAQPGRGAQSRPAGRG